MTPPTSLARIGMAAFAALLAAPVAAQQVVPAQSEIAFVSRQMGVPVEGRFRKWEAQIAFDPRKPEAGRVSFTIDMGSASFGSAETDAEVPKAAWFHVERFPKASFQSTAIKAAGAGRYEVAGKLTLKGLSRDLVVPVTLAQAGTQGTANGQFALKRLDFKIGEGEWADTSMVANDVNVRFKLALSGLATP